MIVLPWRTMPLEVDSGHIQPISGIQITRDSEVKESKNGKQAYMDCKKTFVVSLFFRFGI